MIIANKQINIYYKDNDNSKTLPVIILNNFEENLSEIISECIHINSKEFILVEITNINWNKEMSPWKITSLFKNEEPYLGNADEYLKVLETEIIPEIEKKIEKNNKKVKYYAIAGYSLSGLFGLYSGYKTDKFKKIITASGSMWYPNLENYIKENKISSKVESIYFSLGDKEKISKNPILKSVEEKTKLIQEYLSNKVKTIYEENEGNHFNETAKRIAKGIKWSLEN